MLDVSPEMVAEIARDREARQRHADLSAVEALAGYGWWEWHGSKYDRGNPGLYCDRLSGMFRSWRNRMGAITDNPKNQYVVLELLARARSIEEILARIEKLLVEARGAKRVDAR